MPGWNPLHPPPAPPGMGKNKVLPETQANWLSFLTFFWVNPLLSVGFSRPLEEDDLWELPSKYLASEVAGRVEHQFYARCAPEKRPKHLRDELAASEGNPDNAQTQTTEEIREEKPDSSKESDSTQGPEGKKKVPTKPANPYDESCFKALYYTFFSNIWWAGGLCLVSDTLKTTSPLIVKALLNWLLASYYWVRLTDEEKALGFLDKPQGIGRGIGLVIGLFLMQQVSSLAFNHCYQISYITGVHVRTGLIGSIFRKSLRLSGRARLDHSVGQITTMISKDTTGLEQFMYYAHQIWVSPIQIVLGFGLLIGTLGYSALVGLGVLIFGLPVQGLLGLFLFKMRAKGIKITDSRVKLTTEVLQGIRLLKLYAWEAFYAQRIGTYRRREINILKQAAAGNAALVGSVTFLPTLAAVLSFITYSLSGHDLNVAVIFSAFALFNIIRQPLVFFPLVAASLTEALVALGRISKFLAAEELAEPYLIDGSMSNMIEVDGDFTWEITAKKLVELEATRAAEEEAKKQSIGGTKKETGKEKDSQAGSENAPPSLKEKDSGNNPGAGESTNTEPEEEKPFALTDLKFEVPRNSFVAIVGPVGSGKSSVLQALVGEMRKTRGTVSFGGSLAYVPQAPWVRNATFRENITFGCEDDEKRFRDTIHACCLEPDLEILPHGEYTEIGEKGINLSGGQKARISLARAAYSHSDVVLLDDPLSAVDAHVGRRIMDECLLSGPLSTRTRVLVTHALHFLDKVDQIYVVDKGKIIESGSYQDLMRNSSVFSALIAEHGNTQGQSQQQGRRGNQANLANAIDEAAQKAASAALMQAEERSTGAVSWNTYKTYFRYAGGLFWLPIILSLVVLNECAQVANSLFLSFWTAGSIRGFSQGDYIGVYAGIGAAQALTSFLLCLAYVVMGLFASLNLFNAALTRILGSPISFFDTTPIGRITNRLSKDQDTLDAELPIILWSVSTIFASVLGTAGLIFYTFPYLGIIFAPAIVIYWFASLYYRRTSVETKRLDSILRSSLYASFSETLTGLPTIRAYRNQGNVTKNVQLALDRENRTLYLTITIQRWLALRLDFFANLLLLGIGIFAICFRHSVNPSKIGLVLTYTLSLTQVFTELISQFAQNEQNMNAVERIVHYAELPVEGATTTPEDPPPAWPSEGVVEFSHVDLAYREGLPLVLKDVTFQVKPGEKVGIVGRTGAGKSSLIQALLRTAELSKGQIIIDGFDISKVGLDVLRHRVALVPQDSVLFFGSLRDNLDPQNLRTDAELISVLQRAWLLPKDGPIDPAVEAKFSLDAPVGDDGSNFSAGEKQLLALCRALVKNSKIIILDEATSSVDVETDAKVQRTIQSEFASATLLCIAHRLNTIAYYDRVIVMDAGNVAEFDTVLNLFDRESSIFRSLCDEANLSREDILRIRSEHTNHTLA